MMQVEGNISLHAESLPCRRAKSAESPLFRGDHGDSIKSASWAVSRSLFFSTDNTAAFVNKDFYSHNRLEVCLA